MCQGQGTGHRAGYDERKGEIGSKPQTMQVITGVLLAFPGILDDNGLAGVHGDT